MAIDYKYRLWLLKYLAGVVFPPLALTAIILRLTEEIHLTWRPGSFLRHFLYSISIPIYGIVAGYVTSWRHSAMAKRMGAIAVPSIRGKRICNIDLLARFSQGTKTGYVGQITSDLLDEAGVNTAAFSFLGTDRIITRDHHVVKFILKTGFNDFGKGKMTKLRNSLGGRAIFNVDGEAAKAERALALPYFAKDRISDYDCIHRYTDKMINVLIGVSTRDKAVEVQDIFMRATFDTAGAFLFGTDDLNTLDLPLPEPGEARLGPKGIAVDGAYGDYAQALDQELVNLRVRATTPAIVWTAREFFSDTMASVKVPVRAYLRPLVTQALEKEKRRAGSNNGDEISFLDHLVQSTEDVPHIQSQLGGFMTASRDTTATLLSFTSYMLAMEPEVMARLREEVVSFYGTSEMPTYDNLKRLKYLRAVLDETLRLFPPAPFLTRESKNATVIPTESESLYVPAGVQIIWSLVSIHRRKDIWGEDAEEFRPERFLDPIRLKALAGDPYQFMPFGGGPRICLGMQFAYNEASFMLVRLLQTFDRFTLAQAEAAPEGSLPPAEWKDLKGRQAKEQIHPQTAVTMYSKGGIWLRMHQAE
ncbi:hypothetical protein FRB95_006304 [Tulasnella sp. JGI-2019a]|nr:hypothetical protein FRB93_006324 [Tulasnella sp. JGI-2019a]KAG9028584.1 hypothetical protein FRB95_006304 [Tulasnella sp. JGI-2019a]